jgi:xanthosine utilization system XapX-like protein
MTNLFLAGQVSGALIAILSLVGMLVKYGIVKPIKAYIDQMTYAIQPHANGGKSLPDLINKVDELKVMLDQHIKEHDTPK